MSNNRIFSFVEDQNTFGTWFRYSDIWDFQHCNSEFGLKNYPGRIPGQIIQNLFVLDGA